MCFCVCVCVCVCGLYNNNMAAMGKLSSAFGLMTVITATQPRQGIPGRAIEPENTYTS